MTRITVGIPACDSARTLARAIASIRAQTVTDWRLVVSDDASTDGSAAIAEAAAQEDSRITFCRQPKRRGAMNFGDLLVGAGTPFFVWLAADDYWAPGFLARTLAALEADDGAVSALPRAAFLAPTIRAQPPDTAPLDGPWPVRVRRFFADPGGTRMYGLMRTAAAQAAFPPRAMHAYDWALMLGLLAQGTQVEVPEVLLFREETDWLHYSEAAETEATNALYRRFPVLEMSLLALRRGHVPRGARGALAALNLRKHEERMAICQPAAFGRRLWLYRRLGLHFATDPVATARLMRRVAARDPRRAAAALQVMARIEPSARLAAPARTGSAAPPLTAIVTARNAEGTLDRLLAHLYRQGARAVVIDHGSTDRTRAIALARRGAPVTEVLDEPFDGVFDLTAQLRRKRAVMDRLGAGWVIHADADEFLDAPDGGRLCDLVAGWDDGTILAAPCRELAFLPENDDERHEPAGFEATMLMCAPLVEHDPKQRLFRAGADLALWMATGGHTVTADPARLAPATLTLRHYPGLSLDDLRAQYLGRVFAQGDRMKRWHTNRLTHGVRIAAPPPGSLAALGGLAAPPLTALPVFAAGAAEPTPPVPAGPVDLWVIAATPAAGAAVAGLAAERFPGLRIARAGGPPDSTGPVLHALAHPARALEAATGPDAQREAACHWLRAIARTRQASLRPGQAYAELRVEDLTPDTVVRAVQSLILGPTGRSGFVRPAATHVLPCPGPALRAITTPMARDLGYDWDDPA